MPRSAEAVVRQDAEGAAVTIGERLFPFPCGNWLFSTRAIIVARPVYSPNLYFQMIGRGLRGVKNGGNERCLILDVNDNIVNFERNLAFTELDWLWD